MTTKVARGVFNFYSPTFEATLLSWITGLGITTVISISSGFVQNSGVLEFCAVVIYS